MGKLNIRGQVVYAAAPWATEVPAAGVRVVIRESDFLFDDDFIFDGTTGSDGKYGGESKEWDDVRPFDLRKLLVQVTGNSEDGSLETPWMFYGHSDDEDARIVLPWAAPNWRQVGEVL